MNLETRCDPSAAVALDPRPIERPKPFLAAAAAEKDSNSNMRSVMNDASRTLLVLQAKILHSKHAEAKKDHDLQSDAQQRDEWEARRWQRFSPGAVKFTARLHDFCLHPPQGFQEKGRFFPERRAPLVFHSLVERESPLPRPLFQRYDMP